MVTRFSAFLALLCLSLLASGSRAAAPQPQAHHPVVRSPEQAVITHPLRQVPELPDVVHDVRKLERKMLPNRLGSADNPEAEAVQSSSPGTSAATTDASFDGLGNRNGVLPPDTVGAIGPNHYVQMTNLSFAVYDRSGAVVFGPVNNNTLWSALGNNNVCVKNNDGDPVVLYDEAADRWLASQFALPRFPNGPFYQCIAVSQTGDPTGAWYLYVYRISDTKLNDYPKFGVWPDGYYMSINQFQCNIFSCNWQGAGVVAFERDKMLAGDPTALGVYFDLYSVDPNLGGLLPSDWDGVTPPPAGSPNIFIQMDDDAWGYTQGQDQLQLWDFHVDWSTPSNSSFSLDRTLTVDGFDSNLCNYSRNCIPQPGGVAVDSLSDRLMFRLQYRNFGDHQSLVTNHSVDVGDDRAGVRWYELRDTGGGWSVHQQGTFAPGSDHRWLGSAAMNGAGDIGLGYSVSSTSTYPSIRYTGRLNGDSPGTMTLGEGTIIDGGGSQSHSSGRWGDYSALTVDPVDDCSFWYTQEYYSANSSAGWQTRIGSFKLADCGGPVDHPPVVTLTSPVEGEALKGTVTLTAEATDDGMVTQVEFFVDGAYVSTDTEDSDGWTYLWDSTVVPEGTHTIQAVATDNASPPQTGSDSHTVTVDNVSDPTMHVANLDGASIAGARGRWDAEVTVTIEDGDDIAVSGATVSGSWGDGATGSGSCSTGGDGKCTLDKRNLKGTVASVSFTVTSVSSNSLLYTPEDNTKPPCDSNGVCTITIPRP